MTNILYLCDKTFYEQKMSRVRFHSMQAVGEKSNLMWWGPNWEGWINGSIKKNIENLESKIDLIVVYKPLDIADDWKDLDIPICLRYNETYDQDWTKKEIEQSNASLVIFHHEKDLFGNLEDYRKMLPNVVFEYVPHSAEKTIFKVYEEVDKQYDILLVGASGFTSKVGQHYPIRDRMATLINKFPSKYKVGRFSKPHARVSNANNNHTAIEFAKAINSARICVTDSGAPKSRFGKYVEIPMCGTVIAGDIPNDDKESFRKFVIEINNEMTDEQIISKVVSYLDDSKKLDVLRETGITWSKEYTQERYAERFIEKVHAFLGNSVNNLFLELGEITDLVVPDNYRKIWKDISFNVQNRKADRVGLNLEDRNLIFEDLLKRPYYLVKLANLIGAKNIVEVGTAEGLQFFSFAQYLKEHTTDGKVWSCDVFDKRNPSYSTKYDNANFCLGNSFSLSREINEKIDLFYIDAGHDRNDVLTDVSNLRNFQHENSVWVFDDFDERFGCFHDIQSICSNNDNHYIYEVGKTASNLPNHQVIVCGKI